MKDQATAILDAAAALFAERGVNAVGMGEVARAAGCSRATLYRWFAEAGPAEGAWVFVVGAAIVAVGAVGFFAQHRVLGRRVTSNQ